MTVLPFLHEHESLEIYGPFHWICPLISVCVALLPSLLYTASSPKTRKVAAFLAVWYAVAFYLAQFPTVKSWQGYDMKADLLGFLFFGAYGFVGIGLFYALLYRPDQAVQDLMHGWPVPFTCAQQLYRLGGACFWYMYSNKGMDSYFNLQTGVLDIFMGATGIPLALLVASRPTLKESRTLLLAWHAVGLYDLVFAFSCAIAEFFGLFAPGYSTAYIAFPPVTLICYYQVAWAIGIHLLYLTSIDKIIAAQNEGAGKGQ
jgi:hypothetical protein